MIAGGAKLICDGNADFTDEAHFDGVFQAQAAVAIRAASAGADAGADSTGAREDADPRSAFLGAVAAFAEFFSRRAIGSAVLERRCIECGHIDQRKFAARVDRNADAKAILATCTAGAGGCFATAATFLLWIAVRPFDSGASATEAEAEADESTQNDCSNKFPTNPHDAKIARRPRCARGMSRPGPCYGLRALPRRGLQARLPAMYLGKVMGTVVAEQKIEGLEGVKLLVVQPVDHRGKATGDPLVAADTVRAGPGELVYLTRAKEAAQALENDFVPVDAAIIGIVDQLDAP